MKINRIVCAMVALLAPVLTMRGALNWAEISTSGNYYYGEGHGKNANDAMEQAKAQIAGSIVSHVSNTFTLESDEKRRLGETEYRALLQMRVNTYSNATLTNLKTWDINGTEPNITVRLYIEKAEVQKAFDARKDLAVSMVNNAEKFLEYRNIDLALQHYYWAYSLIRSLQSPYELKDENGNLLITTIPARISEILANIGVEYVGRDGDFIDLLFKYKGEPVSSIEFSYNDGRSECSGMAKDGRGMIEMCPGYTTDVYHLSVDYMGINQAKGDVDLYSVLQSLPVKAFPRAEISVADKGKKSEAVEMVKDTAPVMNAMPNADDATTSVPDIAACARTVETVVNAFIRRNSLAADTCFTREGYSRYRALMKYGNARVVGEPCLKYYKTQNGFVVSRGLRMSFSFRGKVKKTFVEDVVFTLDRNAKIDNVTFGLGKIAEDDIMLKDARGWNDAIREMLLEFMENYKTAYCMKDSVYIRNIFADDATIIVGRVVRRHRFTDADMNMSDRGKEVIRYNRLTKDQYLKNLRRTFDSNEFINLRFTHNDIQWLEKYEKENLFAIQIGQEYHSSSYGDKGYLFLLVDMTNPDAPLIKVRTWQPNEEDISKLYNAGDFRND